MFQSVCVMEIYRMYRHRYYFLSLALFLSLSISIVCIISWGAVNPFSNKFKFNSTQNSNFDRAFSPSLTVIILLPKTTSLGYRVFFFYLNVSFPQIFEATFNFVNFESLNYAHSCASVCTGGLKKGLKFNNFIKIIKCR